MAYTEEMLQNGDSLDGCVGLDEWFGFEGRLKTKYKMNMFHQKCFWR
ncbi:MAG: hypothetical protein K2I10_11460 [Lachnospiraceae bacterium]|nr:hypothetical protein [Lachnospiraceae bacterium]